MWIIPAAPKEASAIAGAGAVRNEDAFCTCDSSTKCALQQRPGLHAAMSLCGTRKPAGLGKQRCEEGFGYTNSQRCKSNMIIFRLSIRFVPSLAWQMVVFGKSDGAKMRFPHLRKRCSRTGRPLPS